MSIAYKVSVFNRKRKWDLFLNNIVLTKEMRVLDVGFSEKEYSSTDNFIEKHYPYPEKLTALGVNVPVEFKKRYPLVTAVHYGGGIFPFADKAFDVCWSNAVIEHVGDRDKQLFFLKEIRRVSRRAFITTPNKHFPIETHTRTPLMHYFPKKIFDRYLTLMGKKWATGNYMHLLSFSDCNNLLCDASIHEYKIIKNRLFGFILDFVIIF